MHSALTKGCVGFRWTPIGDFGRSASAFPEAVGGRLQLVGRYSVNSLKIIHVGPRGCIILKLSDNTCILLWLGILPGKDSVPSDCIILGLYYLEAYRFTL